MQSLDYAVLELRIAATFKEPVKDIHKERAATHFDIPLNSVTEDQRRIGKALNFGDMYHGRPYSPARSK